MGKTNGGTRLARGHSERVQKQEGGAINPQIVRGRGAMLALGKRNGSSHRPHRFAGGCLDNSSKIAGRAIMLLSGRKK